MTFQRLRLSAVSMAFSHCSRECRRHHPWHFALAVQANVAEGHSPELPYKYTPLPIYPYINHPTPRILPGEASAYAALRQVGDELLYTRLTMYIPFHIPARVSVAPSDSYHAAQAMPCTPDHWPGRTLPRPSTLHPGSLAAHKHPPAVNAC